MTADDNTAVPVWTLTTEDVNVPDVMAEGSMTPARLSELRTVLAALAGAPIATLEAHRIESKGERRGAFRFTPPARLRSSCRSWSLRRPSRHHRA